jgi:hypothetical protein
LLQGVRSWRATAVYQGAEPVSSYQAREMAWCASEQLGRFGNCRWTFWCGIPARCTLCPLFDAKHARDTIVRRAAAQRPALDKLPVRPAPGLNAVHDLDLLFDPDIREVLDWQIPEWMDLSPLIPDFPPDTTGQPDETDSDDLDGEDAAAD